jgi:two-component system, NtrC family, sensor histidine kinase PilS
MRLPARTDAMPPTEWSLGMDEGLPRLWRGFMAARILVALVLLLLMVFLQATGIAPHGREIILCSGYLVLTLLVRWLGKPERHVQRFDPQWLVTVGADVLVFSILLHWQVSGLSFTPLFALPVLLAAVLGPLLLALGTAATVTLALLADAWWLSITSFGDIAPRYLQAALTGLGLFLVAYLANQLAIRLARQERMVRSSAMAARVQSQVNQLVIDTLSDGVLVIDSNGVVRAANPAAQAMLGPRNAASTGLIAQGALAAQLPVAPFVLAAQPAWQPLVELANNTLQLGRAQQAVVSIVGADAAVHKLSARSLLVSSDAGEEHAKALCVMFLEDLREMEARLRTEKLAAMGRMSAAVAHEIRNPLAAIAQANALLAEDPLLPAQQKLTQMVQHNAKRLARIVDDVLDVSRATSASSSVALLPDAEHMVNAICHDWAEQHSCGDKLWLQTINTQTPASCVVFEEDHLRRVLVNLLDNALRYADKQAASIRVLLEHRVHPGMADQDWLKLVVWSHAPPLDKGVELHLFEPFFSSQSRSSGLGLYICRELCERHGAVIGYERSVQLAMDSTSHPVPQQAVLEGNAFFVSLKIAGAMMQTQPSRH